MNNDVKECKSINTNQNIFDTFLIYNIKLKNNYYEYKLLIKYPEINAIHNNNNNNNNMHVNNGINNNLQNSHVFLIFSLYNSNINIKNMDKILLKENIYFNFNKNLLFNKIIFKIKKNDPFMINFNNLKQFFEDHGVYLEFNDNLNKLFILYVYLINLSNNNINLFKNNISNFNNTKFQSLFFIDNIIKYFQANKIICSDIFRWLNINKYFINKLILSINISLNIYLSKKNLKLFLKIKNNNDLLLQLLDKYIKKNKMKIKNTSNFKKRILTTLFNKSENFLNLSNYLKTMNKDNYFNKYKSKNDLFIYDNKQEVNDEIVNINKCNSNTCLFFFTPHKYRKSVGIIVPKIITHKHNKKSKQLENDKTKFVRFNFNLRSQDINKNSNINYSEISKKTKMIIKDFKVNKKDDIIDFRKDNKYKREIVKNKDKKIFFNDNSSKSNLLILDEDIISMEFIENKNFEISRYLSNNEEFNDFDNIDLRKNNDNIFIDTEESILVKYNINNIRDEYCIFDEESSKLISLNDIDIINGTLKPIKWWFNHSIRHIVIKLNLIDNLNNLNKDIEVIPLIYPLITGYLNKENFNKNFCFLDSKLVNISTNVLLGLKSVNFNNLKPLKKEFSKISAFCFKEVNNIIPIVLEEFKIVQSIIPISIFSILLTRFPVPAANTFVFSFICNDDYFPNTGMQTIQIIKFQITQNSCYYNKKRNKLNIKKSNIFNESICNHIHLDIFRKYNNIKICPWLAISNFIDEFILRTPVLVKCIIDIHNIMIISSKKNLINKKENMNSSKNKEFVILTINLMLPLLIIQSHSIQNIIIGNNDLSDDNINYSSLKLRIDSMIFSAKYLPFKFYNIRNLDLFLDFNIDKTEFGSYILESYNKYINSNKFCKKKGNITNLNIKDDHFKQLYEIIDKWIEDFIFWFDKYVNDCIEFLSINLYVTSRSLELKTGNFIDMKLGIQYSDFFDFNSLTQKFINHSKFNHNKLNNASINIYLSNNIKYIISNEIVY